MFGIDRSVVTYNQMVADLAANEKDVSLLFHALADPTRRDIVSRALDGELSVSALARRYPMSLAAVQKHVVVLERAELVTKHRSGREQIVRANTSALGRAHEALDQLEAVWRERLERIDHILSQPDDGEPR
jgi:DNA-binding transcriptional ArsR family regulator